MSDLGDLLELLHGAHQRYRSVRGTVRHWRDEALCRRAAMDEGAIATGPASPPATGETERTSRYWLVVPRQVRCERELEWAGERRMAVTVGNAGGWWYRDPRFQAEFFDEEIVGVELPELALFDPWEVARGLTFESAQRTTHSTRDAVRARAARRDSGSLLTPGADRYELAVDAEHGVILTLTALSDETPIEVHEIVDLAFDEDLDPELFRLEGAPEPSERSPTLGRPPRPILCSFCGKSQRAVMQLIAGPGVYICDQCLDLCNEIVREALGPGQA